MRTTSPENLKEKFHLERIDPERGMTKCAPSKRSMLKLAPASQRFRRRWMITLLSSNRIGRKAKEADMKNTSKLRDLARVRQAVERSQRCLARHTGTTALPRRVK